jgi:hypothetical protein
MGIFDYLFDDETAVAGLKTLTDSVKNKAGGSNNIWFRYRNLDFNQSCTIRFLPSAPDNMAGQFWLPKKIIRLKFSDPVNVGQDVNIAVPVMQMYTGGKTSEDPILGQVTRLYEQADALSKKGETEKSNQVRAIASAHYIRGEAIAQCFVVHPGFKEENDPPENPVRLIELNKQIINVIRAKIETDNPELKLDAFPCHAKKGYNFIIKKTKTGDGKYAKWDDGTGFSSKVSPWTEDQKAQAEKFGLWDLTAFLPNRPGDDEYKMLAEIVRLSILGDRQWNPDWEAHLSAVKVYRTAQAGDEEESATTYSAQVKNVLDGLGGTKTSTTKTDDVLSSLSRTASNHETPDAAAEDPEASPDPEAKQSVSSLVDKLKRQQVKTATPND